MGRVGGRRQHGTAVERVHLHAVLQKARHELSPVSATRHPLPLSLSVVMLGAARAGRSGAYAQAPRWRPRRHTDTRGRRGDAARLEERARPQEALPPFSLPVHAPESPWVSAQRPPRPWPRRTPASAAPLRPVHISVVESSSRPQGSRLRRRVITAQTHSTHNHSEKQKKKSKGGDHQALRHPAAATASSIIELNHQETHVNATPFHLHTNAHPHTSSATTYSFAGGRAPPGAHSPSCLPDKGLADPGEDGGRCMAAYQPASEEAPIRPSAAGHPLHRCAVPTTKNGKKCRRSWCRRLGKRRTPSRCTAHNHAHTPRTAASSRASRKHKAHEPRKLRVHPLRVAPRTPARTTSVCRGPEHCETPSQRSKSVPRCGRCEEGQTPPVELHRRTGAPLLRRQVTREHPQRRAP